MKKYVRAVLILVMVNIFLIGICGCGNTIENDNVAEMDMPYANEPVIKVIYDNPDDGVNTATNNDPVGEIDKSTDWGNGSIDLDDNIINSNQSLYVAYTTDRVKVRQQPNTDCEVLGMINVGDSVTVLGAEGDWSHVNASGVEGYIKSEFLTAKEPSGTVNDVANVTTIGNESAHSVSPAEPSNNMAPAIVMTPDTIVSAVTTPVTPVMETLVAVAPSQMVWLSATGDCYHSINNCGRMNPNKATQVTLDEAISRNFSQCSKCW